MDIDFAKSMYSHSTFRSTSSTERAEAQASSSAASLFNDTLSAAISHNDLAGEKETPQIAPPGGSKSTASDLLRMLGAKTEGVNASSAANGQATAPESFFAELMRDPGQQSSENDFARLMHGMVENAYFC